MSDSQSSQGAASGSGGVLKAAAVAGLLAGTLDIVAAMIQFLIATGGANPVIVLQYIASGVFGPLAFSGSILYPCAGLLFHLVIATSWAGLFFEVYPRIALLRKSFVISGIAYGVIVWLAMTKIVVPLSYVRPVQHTLVKDLVAVAILMVFVGIPIAWRASRRWPREGSGHSADNP